MKLVTGIITAVALLASLAEGKYNTRVRDKFSKYDEELKSTTRSSRFAGETIAIHILRDTV